MKTITRTDILTQRLANNGLSQPFADIQHLLTLSLGIQAQYLNHALFNIARRVDQISKTAIVDSLEPTILAWGQRQTYHFYTRDSWQAICHFLTDEELWVPNYFATEKLDLEAECLRLEEKLHHPRLRSQLVNEYGADWSKLFLWSALFLYNSRKGYLYHQWQATDRLVHWQKPDLTLPNHLARQLLENYFSFYGPATLADAAHFFGLRQEKIRQMDTSGLQSYAYDGKTFYATTWHENAQIPEVVLLGKFDPLLVAYQHKDILIDPHQQAAVWKKAGQISALVLIRGKMRGTWTMSVSGATIRFQVLTEKALSKRQQARIRRMFKEYARWTQKQIKTISFQSTD